MKTKSIMLLCTVPDGRIEKALEKAAQLGYRSIFCGPEDNEKARSLADVTYITDWSDTEELIRIAKKEGIDGVVGLSDPAVLPAARLAQALGLAGNTPDSLNALMSKDKFRDLQEKAGLFCPKHAFFNSFSQIGNALNDFSYPLIVKPRLCSSSFGQTILEDKEGLKDAFEAARLKSRDGCVCIEEYISSGSLCSLEADVFVVGDDIIWEGLRDSWHVEGAKTRPLYDVYPAHISEKEREEFRRSVSTALKAARVTIGEYNVEGFFTGKGEFFIVEINTRQAGYYNPQHIELCSGVDLTKLLLTTAVKDMQYYEELKDFRRTAKNILSYSIFAMEDGYLDHVYIDPVLKTRLRAYDSLLGQEKGAKVDSYKTAKWPIVQAAFEFQSGEELEEARKNIEKLVYVVLK